jgi:hypothetical protein
MKFNVPSARSLYQATKLLLAFFILLSFTVIAFDYHPEGFSNKCAICHAKISINGTQDSSIFLFYPTVAHYKPVDEPFNITTAAPIFRKGRAPPELT